MTISEWICTLIGAELAALYTSGRRDEKTGACLRPKRRPTDGKSGMMTSFRVRFDASIGGSIFKTPYTSPK